MTMPNGFVVSDGAINPWIPEECLFVSQGTSELAVVGGDGRAELVELPHAPGRMPALAMYDARVVAITGESEVSLYDIRASHDVMRFGSPDATCLAVLAPNNMAAAGVGEIAVFDGRMPHGAMLVWPVSFSPAPYILKTVSLCGWSGVAAVDPAKVVFALWDDGSIIEPVIPFELKASDYVTRVKRSLVGFSIQQDNNVFLRTSDGAAYLVHIRDESEPSSFRFTLFRRGCAQPPIPVVLPPLRVPVHEGGTGNWSEICQAPSDKLPIPPQPIDEIPPDPDGGAYLLDVPGMDDLVPASIVDFLHAFWSGHAQAIQRLWG